MQFFYKGIITVVVLIFWFYPGYLFLRMIWKSQIDPKATCSRIVTFLSPASEEIATREPDKIYQDGKVVGTVLGKIKETSQDFEFFVIYDTSQLNSNIPIEYKRHKLKIISNSPKIGLYFDSNSTT